MQKLVVLFLIVSIAACSKKDATMTPVPPSPPPFAIASLSVDDSSASRSNAYFDVVLRPSITFVFTAPVNRSSLAANLSFQKKGGGTVAVNLSYSRNDSAVAVYPAAGLDYLAAYDVTISTGVRSTSQVALNAARSIRLVTEMDTTDKLPRVSDSSLLDNVEKRTFAYFWDFGHPVSGMARERNTSGDIVTTGGTGFGIMALLAGIHRNFISRAQGLARIDTIVSFLMNRCTRYHGTFSHWINGATGATVPFSQQDDGGDLVETAYLVEGLLCARQFFNGTDAGETELRNNINQLWNGIEWNWFRNGQQDVLFWHWSPNYGFAMNVPVKGWNEALVAYVLAASSDTDSIPKAVYDQGWASGGAMANGSSFYGITLPLGPDYGGPLFFSQYSFLGIDPHDLSDAYASYFTQNTAQSLINYNYCVANPQHFYGYGPDVWGLTASDDDQTSYAAHSPTNDDGVIAPTAALSALPYTPVPSMNALRFYYYKLGDRLFGEYGFIDAFNLSDAWFAKSFLAIDQGPEMVMIENYRSGLLWQLFMSCPEIKRGMTRLGFHGPNL